MLDALASFLVVRRNAWIIVVLTALLAAGAAVLAGQVERDDDLLAFLPENNEDIATFRAINERFGALDVALIGVETPQLWDPVFLQQLYDTTRAVGSIQEVAHALSITNLEDFEPDAMGGIKVGPLVDRIPSSPEEAKTLQERVMSRDHVVGTFVSPKQDATMLLVFFANGADPKTVAPEVQRLVEEGLPGYALHYGGAPFISTWIYETTQADMRKLTPWAVIVIVLLLLVSFRDLKGALLALVTTGVGIAVANAAMAVTGTPLNIVLSSMPVILFAVGSAYAIHVLARFYRLEPQLGREQALRLTLTQLGPVVAASGLTTMAGLGSFATMDIGPMKSFGIFTSLGIGVALLLALVFIPAAIVAFRLTGRDSGLGVEGPTAALTTAVRSHRWLAVGLSAIAVGAAIYFVTRVQTRMDTAAFFSEDSPPAIAERFTRERFGGSQYLQIALRADLKDPLVLREMQRVADRMLRIDGVVDAVHLGEVVALANAAMEGTQRIPDTSAKVGVLLSLLQGNRAVSQLVDAERTEALIQIKLGVDQYEDLMKVLGEAEAALAEHAITAWKSAPARTGEGAAARDLRVSWRIQAMAKKRGVTLPGGHLADVVAQLDAAPDAAVVQARVLRFLGSQENFAELPPDRPDLWEQVAAAVAALGPGASEDAIGGALSGVVGEDAGGLVDDLSFGVLAPLDEGWAEAATAAKTVQLRQKLGLQQAPPKFDDDLRAALADLAVEQELVADPGGAPLSWTLTGQPVLYRGLAQSVEGNQVRSLLTALAAVLLILTLLFRSLTAGLLATLPTAVTLGVIYGAMGAMGVTLDIGTSMLASLIIGAGVDYAVHFVSAWESPGGDIELAPALASQATATAIWANAGMVAAGFFVLTLGEARPLQNVGSLTAAAMVVAALATFVVVPGLANRRSYRR